MDFQLSEEHQRQHDRAYQFGQEQILPGLRMRDRERDPDPEMPRRLAKGGFTATCIPKEYGGDGLDYISLGIICEQLERADTSARVVMSVHTGLHALTVLRWGTEEQRQAFLPNLASGEVIGGFALTEPTAGSDAVNIKTRAERQGDYYILNGEKTWISLANFADHLIVVAVTDPSQAGRANSLSAFIVPRDTPGFRSEKLEGKFGVRAGDTGKIFLENVKVPAFHRIGEEGEGFKVAMTAIDHGRYTVGSGMVGIIEGCLDACIPYARERSVAGEPIGRKQLVQQMIAKMVAGRETGRLLSRKVGWMMNHGMRTTREASLMKWLNCNAAVEAANEAIELFGAYGVIDDNPVERHFRNARGAMIYEGTREIHQIIQAEYELGYREDRPVRCNLPGWKAADLAGLGA